MQVKWIIIVPKREKETEQNTDSQHSQMTRRVGGSNKCDAKRREANVFEKNRLDKRIGRAGNPLPAVSLKWLLDCENSRNVLSVPGEPSVCHPGALCNAVSGMFFVARCNVHLFRHTIWNHRTAS